MRVFLIGLTFAVATSFAAVAAADVPSPDQSACQGKSVGASCTPSAGGSGSCQNSTCSKTLPTGDGGFTTTSYACVLCVAGSADAGADAGGGGGGGGSSSSGCSVGRAGSMASALALAMAVPVLVRRRRRRG